MKLKILSHLKKTRFAEYNEITSHVIKSDAMSNFMLSVIILYSVVHFQTG